MKTTKVTKQRFNTIKAQLNHPGNSLEVLAGTHGLKPSTIRAIRGCKDYATYLHRTSKKAREAAKAEGAHDSLLDSNLTEDQATAFLTMSTDLQTAREQVKVLKRTLKARNKMIEVKDQKILDLRAQLQNASDVHTILEKAKTGRKLKRSFLSRFRRAA